MINDVDHSQPQPEKHFWTEDMSKECESFHMPHFDPIGDLGDVGIEATANPKASKLKYDIICFQCRKYYNDTCHCGGKGDAISCSYYDKF
jgi:hypothetical protein